jgi:hypothetical protein
MVCVSVIVSFSYRIIVQPWLSLTHLNISYNKLKYLDDSLQVLPSVKVVNIMPVLLANHFIFDCLFLYL